MLTHPLLRDKPFILETPGMDDGYDLINLQRAWALIAGEDLPTLPPEAFLFKRRSAASAPAVDDVDLAPAGATRPGRRAAAPGRLAAPRRPAAAPRRQR
jgi:hypothetical protein